MFYQLRYEIHYILPVKGWRWRCFAVTLTAKVKKIFTWPLSLLMDLLPWSIARTKKIFLSLTIFVCITHNQRANLSSVWSLRLLRCFLALTILPSWKIKSKLKLSASLDVTGQLRERKIPAHVNFKISNV